MSDQQHEPARQQHQRLDREAARARPTTPRAARGSSCRPGSRRPRPSRRRRAPSARPRRQPLRPAAREPATVGGAHQAQRSTCSGPRRRGSAAAPSARAGARATAGPVAVSKSTQPRREPVVAGRAALAERVEHGVGGVGRLPRRLERIGPPGDRHLVRIPGATGQDAG